MDAREHRARAREILAEARAIVSTAQVEGKSLTTGQKARVDKLMAEAKDHSDAADTRDRVNRANGELAPHDTPPGEGAATGWKAAARGLGRERTAKVEVKLGDLLGKAPVTPPTAQMGISRRPGIAPLVEDARRMYEALPQADPGAGTLHIEHLEIGSHSIASGTVERDPLSTAGKAEVDVDINFESVDLKQFAVICSSIPTELFAAEESLETTLRATLGLELDEALDMHVYKALDDTAGVAVVSGGSNFQTKLRRAISDIRKQGGEADVAFVSDADMETMDNLSAQDTALPRGYPWGLKLVPSPLLGTGEFVVLDRSGVRLHKAGATFLRDPYSGMNTNTERIRLEFKALAEVIEPRKIVKSGASLVT